MEQIVINEESMKQVSRYTTEHTVMYSETDARGVLSLPSFFALFQEAALLHAEELGFGETYSKQENLMWVLSRLLLEIDAFPKHRDRIRLSTWPKQPQGPFAIRDYILESEEGTVCARATSSWLLLKLDTMRPIRPQTIFANLSMEGIGLAVEGTAPKISEIDNDSKQEMEVTARYSDLDQNNHVNNTRYVRWFLDCYTPEEITTSGNLHFAINYLQAASYSDKLLLRRYDTESDSSVYGYLEDGTPSFSARIERKSD
jgi:acyl-CoA thioesterase FadM